MFVIISILIVVLDQLSKLWVKSNMMLFDCITFGNFKFFELYYIQNNGAAYSILQGKQLLLILFTLVVMIGIIVYAIVDRKKISKFEFFSLSLILGGGIGNLIDRVMNGFVVDFINIKVIPVFNVADIAITCGCILFAIAILFPKKK